MKYFLFLSLLLSSLLSNGQVAYTMNVHAGGGISGYYGDLGSDFSYERFTLDVGASFEVRKRNWAFNFGSGFTDIGHLSYITYRDPNGEVVGRDDVFNNRSGAYVHAGARNYLKGTPFFYGLGLQHAFIRRGSTKSPLFEAEFTFSPTVNHVMVYGEFGYNVELSRHFEFRAVFRQTAGIFTFVNGQETSIGNPVQSVLSTEFVYRFR